MTVAPSQPTYKAAPKPPDEAERLAALRHYDILDTDPEQAFDDLTLLASFICGTPMSVVSLIDEDRQWFKSSVGIEATQSPRDVAFCAHAILGRDLFIVPNATQDERFAGNPLVTGAPNIRFYAGAPLVTPGGQALGTLCVIDSQPRELSPAQLEALEALGRQVSAQLELRRNLHDLKLAMDARNKAEAEKAVVDAEIARDLRFAREFQQAMMPEDYLDVPDAPSSKLRLNFHHVYRPALSLGGDFFDVIKLSEHRAGVFLADVMGHGARSALVTAILRTLLQDMAHRIEDPAELLMQMNRHFFDIIQDSHQFLFASAFYLVVDSQTATATYASAGHPAPLLANRHRGSVEFVGMTTGGTQVEGAALGLERESVYANGSREVCDGDVFVLFTDGVVEAPDAEGEEFGEERLLQAAQSHLNRDAGTLSRGIEAEVLAFTGTSSLPDDLCLVVVEANAASELPSAL